MQARTVSVRGDLFQTEIFEAGAGDPLLYLHGVGGFLPDEPFLAKLAERHHVIAPLLPGMGDSTGSEHLLDIHDLIYYELDLLDALNLRGMPLIGHSLGGMIAAELGAVQPERFSALVLIAPLGLWNADYPVADFFSMTPKELALATYHDPESPAAQAAGKAPEGNEAYIAFMLERAKSLATAAKYLWPIPHRGLDKRLHRISSPTLLVWGESDGIVPPRYAEDFRAVIPHTSAVIIPEAGHRPQLEQPARLADAILDFLPAAGSS